MSKSLQPFTVVAGLSRPATTLVTLIVCAAGVYACGPRSTDVAVVHVSTVGSQNAVAVMDAPKNDTAVDVSSGAVRGPIQWETKAATALARAKQRGVPIVVFVCAEWAAAATKMDRVTWANADVIRESRSFVMLRLDVTNADANDDAAASRFDVKTMPEVLLLNDSGHEIQRVSGYAEPDSVLQAMATALSSN
ncbi:MAG: thioredoxin family protein [Polyangiaceae bacterium]|nr:thioredoxin family protein [Polyangiaceae bacterium]